MPNNFTTKEKATVSIFFNAGQIPGILKVYDSKGRLYFFRDINGQQRLKFNIAKADNFTLNCDVDTVEVLPLSIHLLNVSLPAPDRNDYKKYSIVYNPELTGTPARNFFRKGLIEVGTQFKKQPYPIRVFILLHEIAHFYYSSEENCDIWAAQEFIKRGYNNSTAFYALKNVLQFKSERNKARLVNLFKNLHR